MDHLINQFYAMHVDQDYYEGNLWDSQIPSRRRRRSPVVYSSLTTIQRLRRDLHNILKNEDPFNGSEAGPEDVLIYNIDINKLQVPSTEIGLGSILLKFPVSHSQEQKIEPPSSRLNDAELASQANAWNDNDVDGVLKKEASPKDLEIGEGNSPTMDAAANSLYSKAKKVLL
ncbi:GATA transcription factor 26 [Corchorus olitorius]|uniref:GATA transcription factor 26 n=1 Tax=Corchorus olitorius TaxID=93759 RepID=A0A1R3JB44_9ROSI|nr:GATA transcription factor 26 [Corchorus olitorius]